MTAFLLFVSLSVLAIPFVLLACHFTERYWGARISDTAILITGWVVAVTVACFVGRIAYRTMLRQERLDAGQCTTCGYSLRGLPEPRCPECGTPFDPDPINSVR